MLFAGGQWASAKRSVADMGEEARARGAEWTMVHACYADSGGFVLKAKDYPAFPVSAKQLHYLVSKQYLPIPRITREEIWDKSKADFFANLIAFLQVAWFLVQLAARGIQKLPVTLLELGTLALLTCAGSSFFFWFYKPLDVSTPIQLDIDNTIATVLREAKEAAKEPWLDTPLDFIEPLAYTSTKLPGNKIRSTAGPLKRIPNDRDSWLHDFRTLIIVAIPTAAFSLFHLIAWNFHFPTPVEREIWRWSCVGGSIVLAAGSTIELWSIVRSGYTETGLTNLGGYKLKWPNNVMFFLPACLYVTGRLIVIVEILLSLRAAPEGCFATPNWTGFLPHVG